MVTNVHHRVVPAPIGVVGPILDDMLSPGRSVWPSPPWSPLRLDRGLEVGSRGGHGAIRYEVVDHRPGRSVRFRFHPALGVGYHELTVHEAPEGTEVRHLLVADLHGRMRWLWPLAVRWLHDAVIRDLLDNWERAATGTVRTPNRWSPWVRLLRLGLVRDRPAPDDRPTGEPTGEPTGQPTASRQSSA
jgi:hypothetical protein